MKIKQFGGIEYANNISEFSEILQKKYIGFIINDWIQLNFKELIELCEPLDNKIADANNKIELLKNEIDSTKYPLEFSGRKEIIINNIILEKNKQISDIEKRKIELDNILKQKEKFDFEELSLLSTLKTKYEMRITHLKKINFK